jgi:hypothetical protein
LTFLPLFFALSISSKRSENWVSFYFRYSLSDLNLQIKIRILWNFLQNFRNSRKFDFLKNQIQNKKSTKLVKVKICSSICMKKKLAHILYRKKWITRKGHSALTIHTLHKWSFYKLYAALNRRNVHGELLFFNLA